LYWRRFASIGHAPWSYPSPGGGARGACTRSGANGVSP